MDEKVLGAKRLLESKGYIVIEPGFFDTSLCVSREDVTEAGYDGANLEDDTMRAIAGKYFASKILMDKWWEAIKVACEDLGVPKLPTEGDEESSEEENEEPDHNIVVPEASGDIDEVSPGASKADFESKY